ncbi:TPA: autotransporter outer membrane beta-barrel domain-containing protein, partial [Escherichia coli]|nr:autotransporter outer membrane beta-barrel domain-containing protein [Escherichia coli]
VNLYGENNIKDYFSIATCGGTSSKCTKPELKAEANIKDSATVGASVTIIGDAAKGVLTIDNSSKLYTQQLWVSGNDNDIDFKGNDDSNGELLINNKSAVYVVSSQNDSPFKTDNISWNNDIVTRGNNITGATVGTGDLILGKTGNGVIKVQDSSALNVSHDLIVSTGVDGAPNTKASTIDITNNSNVTVKGNMRGGVSAAGKLYLTMNKASGMDVNGNVSVGIGDNSDISVTMYDKSSMNVVQDFKIAAGNNSKATLTIDGSTLSVNGSSSIGSGNGSETTVSLTNRATITGTNAINIAEGNNTHVEMTINDSSLTTEDILSIGLGDSSVVTVSGSKTTLSSKGDMIFGQGTGTTTGLTLSDQSSVTTQGVMSVAKGEGTIANVDMSGDSELSAVSLSIGEGKASDSTLYGNGATLTTQKGFVAAKGEEATAKLDYTNSKLATGSAVIAGGNNASAELKLEQSSFTSNGAMDIGQGTKTTTALTLNNKS